MWYGVKMALVWCCIHLAQGLSCHIQNDHAKTWNLILVLEASSVV
jgi:hypothetical protein